MLPHGCFLDKNDESNRFLCAIDGYEKVPLVSLEKAIEPLICIVPDIENNARLAKKNSFAPADNLSSDQSASIYLYSMESKQSEQSFYVILNTALREQKREKIEPWFFFLKLFLTALARLPSKRRSVFRGIKLNLPNEHPQGKTIYWWGFTSCTTMVDVLQPEKFLGKTGPRTLFIIDCSTAKDISKHSCFSSENEVILSPGTRLEVMSFLDNGNDYHTIQLKEMHSSTSSQPTLPVRSPLDIQKLTELIAKFKPQSDVFLFGKQLNEASIVTVVQLAIIDKRCTGLYLKETNLTSQCVATLADALRHNTTLKGLYLSDNLISDFGAQCLADALDSDNNRTLQSLCLGANSITHDGAEYLARMLKTNRTLKELWLPKNPLGDQGVQALATALACHNQTLEILSVGWNKLTNDATVNALVNMLMNNRSLKKLDLGSCKLSRTDKTRLREAAKSKKTCELIT